MISRNDFENKQPISLAAHTAKGISQRAMTTSTTSSNAPGGLQRHHLEGGLICVSGIRLCYALANLDASGSRWLAAFLFMLHTMALAIEFGNNRLESPFCLRRSESHGVAQGVLAVPSVLAALASTDPEQGTWRAWLMASCIAAVSTILTVAIQSHYAVTTAASKPVVIRQRPTAVQHAKHKQHSAARTCHASNGVLLDEQGSLQSPGSSKDFKQQQQQSSSKQQHAQTTIAGIACCLVAVAAALIASAKSSNPAIPPWQSPLKQHWAHKAAPPFWGNPALQAGIAAAALAPAMYCVIMWLLPSCFSIGEGALMAQGAAGLAAAASLAVPNAAVFIPKTVCQMLPSAVLPAVVTLGGCTNTAHNKALQLDSLPSVILLILASTLCTCLLLRVLLTALRWNSSRGPDSQQTRDKSAATPPSLKTVQDKPICNNHKSGECKFRAVRWLCVAASAASLGVMLVWLGCAAAWTLLEFLPARPRRLLVLLYWVGMMAATLPVLGWWANHSKIPQIIVRKVYHLLAGVLFVPVFFWDLQLLCLSLAIAFAALVLLEVVRKLQLPVLGGAVQQYMQDFVDERDSGVIYVTHFTLLLGLAVPMWLCLGLPGVQQFAGLQELHSMSSGSSSGSGTAEAHAQCARDAAAAPAAGLSSGFNTAGAVAGSYHSAAASTVGLFDRGNSASQLLLVVAGLSGMVIIGVGDTAASMVGKLLGRVPIHLGSRKTVEGTVAGIASSLGAWCLLSWFGGVAGGSWWWLQMVLATTGAGLMEAVTSQLDNVLLPLWYLPHLILVQQ